MHVRRERPGVNVVDVLPRDAIESIDEPTFGETYAGGPDDEVVVVDADPPRAYPVRVLSHHEIVNDSLDSPPEATSDDGRAIAVTWCPICWSGAVYDRRVGGRELTFGVSGKLADDALVMYDRETGTEWKQPTGEAIAGELAGHRLDALAAGLVTYGRFRADNPDGVVLQGPRAGKGQSFGETYEMDGYEAYREREAFGLYGMGGQGERRTWDRTDIDAKTLVLGVERDGAAVGYPVPEIEAAGGVVTDRVGGTAVVVFAAGEAVHAFENPGFAFEAGEDGRFRAGGTTWDPVTGESEDGRALARVPAVRLFAFAWQDAHGPDAFFFADREN